MKHFNLIAKYFPNLSEKQLEQFRKLFELYTDWNAKVNVISRKDIDELYLHHVLHSLAIAKFINFKPNTHIIDIGTGGGFPGIPLAIYFPQCKFYLVDSINKKILVVNDVIKELNLSNAQGIWGRVENQNLKVHFFVTRAVAPFNKLVNWCKKNIHNQSFNDLPNGLISLKGGDLTDELANFKSATIIPLNNYFEEDFFETKKIVYHPL